MHDLAIITVSTNEAHWIRAQLPTVFARMGDIRADVVVVDNDSHDGLADMIASEFPEARMVWSANHGFGHANNRALMTCNARYVLFRLPTEVVSASGGKLVPDTNRPTASVPYANVPLKAERLDATPQERQLVPPRYRDLIH